MKSVRLHTPQRLAAGMAARLDPGLAGRLVGVLRKKPGEFVALFNGDGRDWTAEIVSVEGPEGCVLRVLRGQLAATESPLAVTLVQAVGKGEIMEGCIYKAVELGVASIAPVLTERTHVKVDAGWAGKRCARWRKVAIAACEQSGRAVVPEIREPVELARFEPGPGTRLFLAPDGDLSPGGLAAPVDGAIVLAVGPEDGYSAEEARWLGGQGFSGLTLGPRILRTETAGPAALAILQARFGDLG